MAAKTITSDDPIFQANKWVTAGSDLSATGQGSWFYDPFGSGSPGYQVKFGDQSPYVSIEELFDQRPGTPFKVDLHREYVRRFRVLVKTKFMGASFVCRCPGLPVPFAPYIPYRVEEYDRNAKAVDISAAPENHDDFQAWIVTVKYSTDMPAWGCLFGRQQLGWDEVNGVQNAPWKIPPVLEWDTETYTEYPMLDLYGQPFINTAGQPFTPAPGFTRGYRVVTITRFEKDFETRVEDYCYVVNSVDFKGSAPGYALCTGPRATEMSIGDVNYHKVTYKVLLKKRFPHADGTISEPFNPARILNAGMYQIRTTWFGVVIPRAVVPIVRYGHAVTHPVLLDLEGREQTAYIPETLDDDLEVLIPANTILKPTYIEREVYREVDLNVLTTPQS